MACRRPRGREPPCLAPRRELLSHHHDVQVLAQLLVLLDGLEARGRVAVVATSNRLEAIDPALCRPGRFDYHIEVPVPDQAGRLAILKVYVNPMKTRDSWRFAGGWRAGWLRIRSLSVARIST